MSTCVKIKPFEALAVTDESGMSYSIFDDRPKS